MQNGPVGSAPWGRGVSVAAHFSFTQFVHLFAKGTYFSAPVELPNVPFIQFVEKHMTLSFINKHPTTTICSQRKSSFVQSASIRKEANQCSTLPKIPIFLADREDVNLSHLCVGSMQCQS